MAEVITVRREVAQADEVHMSVGGAHVILREGIRDETLTIELRTRVGIVTVYAAEGGIVSVGAKGSVTVGDVLLLGVEDGCKRTS